MSRIYEGKLWPVPHALSAEIVTDVRSLLNVPLFVERPATYIVFCNLAVNLRHRSMRAPPLQASFLDYALGPLGYAASTRIKGLPL